METFPRASRNPSPYWYDVMIALIYPSILGAIIFSFVDAVVRNGFLPLFHVRDGEGIRFLSALNLGGVFSAAAFICLTAVVVVHFSADFLYSLYSREDYSWYSFLFDTIISALIAVSYVTLTALSRQDAPDVRDGYAIFWGSLAGIYVAFLAWDVLGYLSSYVDDQKSFYRRMIFPFETLALSSWLSLAFGARLIGRSVTYDRIYVAVGIVILGVFSVWLALKTRELRGPQSTQGGRLGVPGAQLAPYVEYSEIRATHANDLDACSELLQEAYDSVYGEHWELTAARQRLSELFTAGTGYNLSLVVDGQVVGFLVARPFAWHDGTRLWIEEIVISEDHRGMGWGSLILDTLEKIARRQGVSGFDLLSAHDSRAQALYRRGGYAISEWDHLERDLAPENTSTPGAGSSG